MDAQRNSRRTLRGTVSSDKMDKTITIVVERMYKHPKYLKYLRRHSKYLAHDPANEARIGDIVDIIECRPTSKNKRWRLDTIIRRPELAEGGTL